MFSTILACVLAAAFSGGVGYAINSYFWRNNLWSALEVKHPRLALMIVFSGAFIGALVVSITGNLLAFSIGLPLLVSFFSGIIGGYTALFQWGN